MVKLDENFLLERFRAEGTSGDELIRDVIIDNVKILQIPFDRFIVDLILSSSDKFLGIRDIKINKDFLSHEQKMHSIGYYDDSEYYQK